MSNIPEVQKSTALAKAEILTDSLKNLLDGGFIYIYSGAVPASPNSGVGAAVLLCKLYRNHPTDTQGLVFDTDATNGVMKRPTGAVWSGTNETSGLPADASFWRFSLGADTNTGTADPDTGYRLQGAVGSDASYSMYLPTVTFLSGAEFVLDLFNYIIPAG